MGTMSSYSLLMFPLSVSLASSRLRCLCFDSRYPSRTRNWARLLL